MRGRKREHKLIRESVTDTVDVYEGRGIFVFEPTTTFLSGKIIVTDILNETAGSCYDCL